GSFQKTAFPRISPGPCFPRFGRKKIKKYARVGGKGWKRRRDRRDKGMPTRRLFFSARSPVSPIVRDGKAVCKKKAGKMGFSGFDLKRTEYEGGDAYICGSIISL